MADIFSKLCVKNGVLWLNVSGAAPISYKIAVGKAGIGQKKCEGDLITPIGCYPLRRLFYRQDCYSSLETGLQKTIINEGDGWCDDETSIHYNQLINIKNFAKSDSIPRHEKMYRDDNLYNIVIEVGYNDTPPKKGLGSAIFIHVAGRDYPPTHGCIALAENDMIELVKKLTINDYIDIIS